MIIYNVTIKIDEDIQTDWLGWIRDEHIPAVMATGCFKSFKILRLLMDEPDGITYSVQYMTDEMSDILKYQDNFARTLQQEHIDRFTNRFVAFRTLLQEVE